MVKAYILLGGNIGDVADSFHRAHDSLELLGTIQRCSAVYRTAAWGITDQPEFLNQVVELETVLSPEELLKGLQAIEDKAGRVRFEKNGPRILDLDILFYDRLVCRGEPEIPHPRLHLRRFTLVPLAEIIPDFVHPVFGKKVSELLEDCPDTGEVKLQSPELWD